MASEQTLDDEIALYILSRMYWKHAFVYTQMFWWMTLLYTWPVQEKELMNKCKVVLVYMKPGAFGELQKIRPPTASSSRVETTHPAIPPLVIPQNAGEITLQTQITLAGTPVITGVQVVMTLFQLGVHPTIPLQTVYHRHPRDVPIHWTQQQQCQHLYQK